MSIFDDYSRMIQQSNPVSRDPSLASTYGIRNPGAAMDYGPAMQQGAPRAMDMSMLGVTQDTGDENKMPELPKGMYKPGDMTGFTNAGMTAPPLSDPQTALAGLMKMAPQQAPQQQLPEGAIMQYLRSLGV